MQKRTFIGVVVMPLMALAVVAQLYVLLPVAQNLSMFLDGASSRNTGMLTTLFGVFYAGGLIVWGGMSDKFGRERVLAIGLLLLAVTSFAIALLKSYDMLLLGRCLQGFCAASYPPVAMAWIAEHLADSVKIKAISLMSCAFLLAGTIGQEFGVLTITNALYGAMWPLALVYGLGAVLFTVLCFSGVVQRKQDKKLQSLPLRAVFYQLPHVLLNRRLFGVYFCALFVLLSFVVLYSVLNTSEGIAVSVLRGIGIVAILLSLTAGYVFRFFKPQHVLAVSLCVMAVSLFVHWIGMDSLIRFQWVIFMAHFIFIAGLAYAIPSMITSVALFSDANTRGISMSLYTCVLFIGASLGAFLPAVLAYRVLLPFVSICLLGCAVQLVLVKRG